ncbi:MAG TPA: hypothetical protein VGS96_17625 [Thermoanaerobaculia bacterium]|jgi:hypothetical protein|nr:hypothetical protein [Thermoanaerobaculia bacterium]
MRAPAASLTRTELTQLIQLAPEVVDALISSGHLLCLMQNGEARVPLQQLEAFFRDGLVQVYRSEAMLSDSLMESTQTKQPATPEALSGAPPPSAAEHADAGEGAGAPPTAEPPRPAPIVTEKRTEEAESPAPDLRSATRFVPRRQIGGIFGDVKFSIVQLSATGLRIRHHEEIFPGAEAKMSFALMKPPRSFVMRARAVWTSVARYGANDDATFHISGLRIIQHVERLTRALEILKAAHELQPERTVRGIDTPALGLESISDDEVALVTATIQKFAADPYEANRWYGRAKFALAEEHVRRAAPPKQRDRDEILGIWEYLDRQIDIPKIAGVVSMIRSGRLAV